ncbi:MAG: sigma-70 family RNA polymerase sigma factor [Atopobiaceae bacterium]|nr:sigma-70 family RNA polymerase sigma factor [Atopobiaceae bacterium]
MGAAALAVDPLGDGCMESRWNVVGGMGTAHMRDREDITATVQAYADTVLRACAVYLREQADREDAFQETFLRYARYKGSFNDEEHRKAWLIRVASNICKDMLKSAGAHVVSLDAVEADGAWQPVAGDDGQEGQRRLEGEEFLAALRTLDEKYRSVLYLKYYEGYTAAQIGEMLRIPENTVYTDLARGRQRLKEALGYV